MENETTVSPLQRSIFTALFSKAKSSHHLIFCFVLVLHFCITYYSLYTRYIFFEMREPHDSASYIQAVWSIFNGSPFTITTQEHWVDYFPYNLLSDQLYFTLALFSPLSLFEYSGLIFLVLQVLIISLGGIFLYGFACLKLKNRWLSLLITIGYFFNPATFLSFQHFGFRPETIFIPLFFAMFFFLEKSKFLPASICLILALLTKHNSIPVVFLLGVYFFIFRRSQWKFGMFCIMASISYYIVGVEIIMKHFQDDPVRHFKHFAVFGDTPLSAVINMIQNPVKVLSLVSETEVAHIKLMLASVSFLSLFNPVFWVVLPQLIMNAVLSDYLSIYGGWHGALVVPFIFVGSVLTIRWLQDRFKNRKYIVQVTIASLLIIGLFVHLNYYKAWVLDAEKRFFLKRSNLDTSEIIKTFSIIEPDASLMVSSNILWFFANRAEVYISRVRFHEDVDYIVMLTPLYLAEDRPQVSDKYLLEEWTKSESNIYSKLDQFERIVNSRNLQIFKRKDRGK